MLIAFILHLLVTALLLVIVDRAIEGIRIDGSGAAIVGALVLGIVNALVRPIVILLTLPLTVITLGLFLLVINALMLMVTAAVVPGFYVRDFGSAFFGSILLSVLNLLLAVVLGL